MSFDDDCFIYSCPCEKNVCPKPCSTLRRVQRRVRMPMTLFTSRRTALTVSGNADRFAGPSDRARPSVNVSTGKRGVDKKHNSFARYLARRTGPVLRQNLSFGEGVGGCGEQCCCCEQDVNVLNTLPSFWGIGVAIYHHIAGNNNNNKKVGIITNIAGNNPPSIVTIKLDDCNDPVQNNYALTTVAVNPATGSPPQIPANGYTTSKNRPCK